MVSQQQQVQIIKAWKRKQQHLHSISQPRNKCLPPIVFRNFGEAFIEVYSYFTIHVYLAVKLYWNAIKSILIILSWYHVDWLHEQQFTLVTSIPSRTWTGRLICVFEVLWINCVLLKIFVDSSYKPTCPGPFMTVHDHYLFSYRECINKWLRDSQAYTPKRCILIQVLPPPNAYTKSAKGVFMH